MTTFDYCIKDLVFRTKKTQTISGATEFRNRRPHQRIRPGIVAVRWDTVFLVDSLSRWSIKKESLGRIGSRYVIIACVCVLLFDLTCATYWTLALHTKKTRTRDGCVRCDGTKKNTERECRPDAVVPRRAYSLLTEYNPRVAMPIEPGIVANSMNWIDFLFGPVECSNVGSTVDVVSLLRLFFAD